MGLERGGCEQGRSEEKGAGASRSLGAGAGSRGR